MSSISSAGLENKPVTPTAMTGGGPGAPMRGIGELAYNSKRDVVWASPLFSL